MVLGKILFEKEGYSVVVPGVAIRFALLHVDVERSGGRRVDGEMIGSCIG